MIDNIETLTNSLFHSFKENEIDLQKIDNVNMFSSYYIDKIKVNTILQIVFDTCSLNNYCLSISREEYAQVKVILFDKTSSEIYTFMLFTIMPSKINKTLENRYNKKISFLKKVKITPVIGPDGVGKTTLLTEVISHFKEEVFFKRFKKIVRHSVIYNIFHPINRYFLRKKIGKKSIKNQHDDVHFLLCIFGALGYYPYLVFQTLFQKKVVFLDRFFYDYLLKNISFMNKNTYLRENWKLLLKLVPKSYFLIHLDANTETILSRKQELSADDIEKYRKLNFKLYLHKPSIVYLYVNTGLKIVQCKNIILSTLTEDYNLNKGEVHD